MITGRIVEKQLLTRIFNSNEAEFSVIYERISLY